MHLHTEKLSRITIEGFRSVRRAELDLGDLTVLIGANGAGKSNVIGFLQMVSWMMAESLSRFVSDWRGADHLLFGSGRVTGRMAGELQFASDRGTSTYGFTLVPTGLDQLIYTHEKVHFVTAGRGIRPFEREFGEGSRESRIPGLAQTSPSPDLRNVCGIFRRRLSEVKVFHFHDTSRSAFIRRGQDVRNDQYLMSEGGNLAVLLRRLRTEEAPTYRRVVEEFRQVLPEFREFVLEEDSQHAGTMELRWTGPSPEHILGPDQFSDGSLRALALIALLLLPDRFLPWVVAIDEPELGLHPTAVGQIARLVGEAATRRQLIVSTQSPTFLAQFDPEDIVVVEKPQDETLFRRLSRSDLQSWLDAYEGDLGRLFEMNVLGGSPR